MTSGPVRPFSRILVDAAIFFATCLSVEKSPPEGRRRHTSMQACRAPLGRLQWPPAVRSAPHRWPLERYLHSWVMNLTTNFSMQEVVCKCGCLGHRANMDAINRSVAILQVIRNNWGGPVIVNSFYRCAFHNVKVNGVPGSHHVKGRAFDIRPSNGQLEELHAVIKELASSALFGVIWVKKYPTFIHVDTRYM